MEIEIRPHACPTPGAVSPPHARISPMNLSTASSTAKPPNRHFSKPWLPEPLRCARQGSNGSSSPIANSQLRHGSVVGVLHWTHQDLATNYRLNWQSINQSRLLLGGNGFLQESQIVLNGLPFHGLEIAIAYGHVVRDELDLAQHRTCSVRILCDRRFEKVWDRL